MNDRWKMNRIGFVNFWLYDEEDFEFEDGKLLLRGQNGSGKSITTQSFIPFVLDGDRTPSRLDPFGSSDRRMEYYFLDEEGKEESTGYLFLEFKKDETGEYRTIGIGQRAKRGKTMDFWGFVLLDGRRIGYDLWLYKEVGSARIPCDKRELKAKLGEDNFFTDSQSEYKKHVNQYIFGFRKAEQYEQFIRLLVKVRAPKLSKEFKPTKVYDILNDSLQTLTDEDLRAMVDAMEKMDEIQDSLDMLRRAFSDVKIIRNEYTRYNQYMLAKKAQGYLGKKQEVESARKKLEEKEKEKREIEAAQEAARERLGTLTEQKKLAETERDGLLDTDMEEMDRRLEQAKRQKEEAVLHEKRWSDKIEECKVRIREEENLLKDLQDRLEQRKEALQEGRLELEEQQELLQWHLHTRALQILDAQKCDSTDEIRKEIDRMKGELEACRKVIRQYEELAAQYDKAAAELELLKKQEAEEEQRLSDAREAVVAAIDQWVTDVFEKEKNAEEWHPSREILQRAEQAVRGYESVEDAMAVQEIFRMDYEQQRRKVTDEKSIREHERKLLRGELEQAENELAEVQNQEELEPERDENAERTRKALIEAGILAVPFYKTVEFSSALAPADCARLEAQLQKMGILDALVVSPENFVRIKEECPEFLDSVLYVQTEGHSGFEGLTVSEELEDGLKKTVSCILSNFNEKDASGISISLGKDGQFRQGILAGKANKSGEAEFVGLLARKRRKEQKIRQLQEKIEQISLSVKEAEIVLEKLQHRLEKLQEEYQSLPGFAQINAALNAEKDSSLKLQVLSERRGKQEAEEQLLAQQKNQKYQVMLQQCRPFPYGRTEEAYEEAVEALEEYRRIWQELCTELIQSRAERISCLDKEEKIDRDKQAMDDAFVEMRSYSTKKKECDIRIRQCEEYLNRPENIQKANRLKQVKELLAQLAEEYGDTSDSLIRMEVRLNSLLETLPEQKEHLLQAIAEETCLRKYFEEELSLKLVLERGERTIPECAAEAAGLLRESDKNRESSDMLQSLYQVYQRHNGSLTSYGTRLEECFGAADEYVEAKENAGMIRKRVRVVSVWNGKKVYLEEFYGILKSSIEETELLIQEKDRELFEDILSKTISQQLTDRIAESRRWVSDMSQLMKEMDTSMGLSFSLDWKPRKAENDAELDTAELEQILLRDHTLLTMEDIEKVAGHFRSKIRTEKLRLEEDGGVINYMDLVRDALDYRRWFEFQMYFRRGEEPRKPLTNAAFNRFSGGEKAMAMYVPLFAAVNAQYKKAEKKDHPRMIALDEAFAGVDDRNISSMFDLVHKLDFDYIMNSQSLWGCFETVKGLRIAELFRPQNSQTVSVIRYTWNGYERSLDVQ